MLYPVSIGGYINPPPSFLYEKTADLEYKNAYQPGKANLEKHDTACELPGTAFFFNGCHCRYAGDVKQAEKHEAEGVQPSEGRVKMLDILHDGGHTCCRIHIGDAKQDGEGGNHHFFCGNT